LESIAETHPQLQPALLRLSAMISQYFTARLPFTGYSKPFAVRVYPFLWRTRITTPHV
jgi:hypothetical protein